MTAKPKAKKCSICAKQLSSSYPKPACKLCIDKIIKDEIPNFMGDIKILLREETHAALLNMPLAVAPSTSGTSAEKIPVCLSDYDSVKGRVVRPGRGRKGLCLPNDNNNYYKSPDNIDELIKATVYLLSS